MLVIKQYKRGDDVPNHITGNYLPDHGVSREKNLAIYKKRLEERLEDRYWTDETNTEDAVSPLKDIPNDLISIVWVPDKNELGDIAP